jgi:hypothetical protein
LLYEADEAEESSSTTFGRPIQAENKFRTPTKSGFCLAVPHMHVKLGLTSVASRTTRGTPITIHINQLAITRVDAQQYSRQVLSRSATIYRKIRCQFLVIPGNTGTCMQRSWSLGTDLETKFKLHSITVMDTVLLIRISGRVKQSKQNDTRAHSVYLSYLII